MIDTLPPALRVELDSLPDQPGVYLFKDTHGKVLYIGKAASLRSRARSYFQESSGDGRSQFQVLVAQVAALEYLITGSEQEALTLEATLVKRHQPRYNIKLKDDKKYPFIRITKEPFPRIVVTRNVVRDGSRYLGPFSNVRAMRAALAYMHRIFPIRSCDYELPNPNVKLCLEYHIKRCQGPCQGLVDSVEYGRSVEQAYRFLRGHNAAILRDLNEQMAAAAEQLDFEHAARLRDQARALESMQGRQKVVLESDVHRDVIGMHRIDDTTCCCVLEIREGRLLGRKHHFVGQSIQATAAEILAAFVRQFYLETDSTPPEIHLPVQVEDAPLLAGWLSQKAGVRVKLVVPQRGLKADTIQMAEANAAQLLDERFAKRERLRNRIPHPVLALQRDLQLTVPPRRIEAVDISSFQGTDQVGSLVCLVDGQPKRSEYRHFRIRGLQGADDYASIRQVVQRRFGGLMERGEPLPDLLMIDGGKGQVSSARLALTELGLETLPVIGLAKRLEEVVVPDQSEPLLLPRTSASLRMLQVLRDEAHRFAINYHRNLRQKRTLHTSLEDIAGIGPRRREELLRHFGSLKRIRAATVEDIAAVPGFSLKLAQVVIDALASSTLSGAPSDPPENASSR